MSNRRVVRICVDCLLAVTMIALMATGISDGVIHEWLGIVAFALVVVHMWLNRTLWSALMKHACHPRQVLSLVLDGLLVIEIIGLAISSLILFRYVYGWLPAFSGVTWARPLHMAASYWLFVVVFVHAGIHIPGSIRGKTRVSKALWAVMSLCIFGVSIAVFVHLEIASYLFLQVQFAFFNSATPLWERWTFYALAAAGCMVLGHWLGLLTSKRSQAKAALENGKDSKNET